MKTLKIACVSLAVFVVLFSMSFAVNAEENKEGILPSSDGTVYEKHVGIFAPKVHSASHEPLLGSGSSVTRPLFNVLDGADHVLGRALHTKTYAEDNNDSFVTLEQEGAKLGYDF